MSAVASCVVEVCHAVCVSCVALVVCVCVCACCLTERLMYVKGVIFLSAIDGYFFVSTWERSIVNFSVKRIILSFS